MNSCLYQGVLRHRLQPKAHHFATACLWPGSISMNWTAAEAGIRRNRFAAAAFYDADYPLGTPLKARC
jgi:DUF1365 family protein